MHFYDAHNHLQVESFGSRQAALLAEAEHLGIRRMVVNGATEEDWPDVLKLAREHPIVLPSFGLHPRYVEERTDEWREALERCLSEVPSAVGEIGLDRWIENFDLPAQEEVFVWQLRLAADRNLPVSIHCLHAQGRLLQLLRENPRPARGFLLHSYGGSREMIEDFARLGAYFSISGQFAQDWKKRQRASFRHVPRERLLVETDAPFMPPPASWHSYPLSDPGTGEPINHPCNLIAIYSFVAELLGIPEEQLAEQVEENFLRLFGGL